MITPGPSGVVVAIPDVQSVFHPLEIESWPGAIVDDVTLRRMWGRVAEPSPRLRANGGTALVQVLDTGRLFDLLGQPQTA